MNIESWRKFMRKESFRMEFYGWSGLSKFEYMNFNIKGKMVQTWIWFSKFSSTINLLLITYCKVPLHFKQSIIPFCIWFWNLLLSFWLRENKYCFIVIVKHDHELLMIPCFVTKCFEILIFLTKFFKITF